MSMRGIRGAITAQADTREEILAATKELLEVLVKANPGLKAEEICSALFTMTPDLRAVHPALAARQFGWVDVPLMCAQEIAVPDSLPRCIRVLVHWNTEKKQGEVHHVYAGGAEVLRPDLVREDFYRDIQDEQDGR